MFDLRKKNYLQILSETFEIVKAIRYVCCFRCSFCKVMLFQGFLLMFEIRKNLDLRSCNLRKNLDLRKIILTAKILVHKLLDLRKIF